MKNLNSSSFTVHVIIKRFLEFGDFQIGLKVNIRFNVASSLGDSVKEEGLIHSSKNGSVSTFLRNIAAIKFKITYRYYVS